MDVSEVIATRLELREWTDQPVDDGTKRAILDAGRLAPSGKNLQHWAFVLLDATDDVDRLADLSPSGGWVCGADFAVVVFTDPTYPYHEIDAGRAVTHLQLEAWNHGVGSCIYTGFDEALLDELDAPDGLVPTLAAGFGHPTRPLESFAGRKDREPLEAVVHHGQFGGELSL